MLIRRRIEHPARESESDALAGGLRERAIPVHGPADLDPLVERIGDARYVLIGEASHGTSNFYRWRAELSKRLIVERGFSFVGVEGDWPDCYRVNRYVRTLPDSGHSAYDVLHAFDRWPTWMWANRDVVEFAEWLRWHNEPLPPDRRAGFYGLDVYSLWESMAEVVQYLERIDPEAARTARRAYACFEPYGEDGQEYARATAFVPASCEGVVYHPGVEHWGNYVPTLLAQRYDAFLFFDRTDALDPLHMPAHVGEEAPETYHPSGQ